MRISANYTDKDWKSLSFEKERDWEKAIKIFKDRIESRFLKPISKIQGYTYAGFAIMALDCLLIETLQQFLKGNAETPRGESLQYFKDFLTKTSFKVYFDEDLAEKFYNQIRCGILHQAEIKRNSRILIKSNMPLVKLSDDGDSLIINRNLFHRQLKEVFNAYIKRLKDPLNKELRENFRKKLDYICKVK